MAHSEHQRGDIPIVAKPPDRHFVINNLNGTFCWDVNLFQFMGFVGPFAEDTDVKARWIGMQRATMNLQNSFFRYLYKVQASYYFVITHSNNLT